MNKSTKENGLPLDRDPAFEWPDPTPVAIPLGATQEESIQDMIQRYVRNELSAAAKAQGIETFEEAMDFDIPGEDDLVSPYEVQPMTEEELNVPDDSSRDAADGAAGKAGDRGVDHGGQSGKGGNPPEGNPGADGNPAKPSGASGSASGDGAGSVK